MPRRRHPRTTIEIVRSRIVREHSRLWRATVNVRTGGWQSKVTASAATAHAALAKAFDAGLGGIVAKMDDARAESERRRVAGFADTPEEPGA